MKILKVKDCPLCGKIIWKFRCPSIIAKTQYGWSLNFRKQPYELNEQGTHFWILCTDSSRMMVAICKDCVSNLTNEQVNRIFADITYTKIKQIEKDRRGEELKYKLFDRVRDIQVYRWSLKEKEIIDFLGEKNAVREHSDK